MQIPTKPTFITGGFFLVARALPSRKLDFLFEPFPDTSCASRTIVDFLIAVIGHCTGPLSTDLTDGSHHILMSMDLHIGR